MCQHAHCHRPLPSATGLESDAWSARWMLPSAVLMLMPKCPACFAAYFLLATGVGVSLTAAVYLRLFLVIFCIGLLALVVALRGAARLHVARHRAHEFPI